MDWDKASPAPDNYRFDPSSSNIASASGASMSSNHLGEPVSSAHGGGMGIGMEGQPRGRGGSGDANSGLGPGLGMGTGMKRDRSNDGAGGPLSGAGAGGGRLAQRRGQGSGMMLGGLSGGLMRGGKGKNRFGMSFASTWSSIHAAKMVRQTRGSYRKQSTRHGNRPISPYNVIIPARILNRQRDRGLAADNQASLSAPGQSWLF